MISLWLMLLSLGFSLFAGILTVASPCILPVLPVILGGALSRTGFWSVFRIVLGLGGSIFLFTWVLKISTVFIGIAPTTIATFSGIIILLFGLALLFPTLWTRIALFLRLEKSQELLNEAGNKKGAVGELLLGAALGPVFSSCSPTYAYILGTVLQANKVLGVVHLLLYILGLLLPLLLIAYFGQRVAKKLQWLANPEGAFRRGMGGILVLAGILMVTGMDKQAELWLIEQGLLGTTQLEITLREQWLVK